MSGSAEVIKNMYAWATLKRAGCEGVSKVAAAQAQNYARTHRIWQDQSGHARGLLNGGMYWETMAILKIFIAHGVEYGIYLELAHDRKYQILEEALKSVQDSWFNGVKKIMES